MYRQASNISRTLVGKKIVDYSYVVGASLTYIFILDITPGLNGLGKENTRCVKKQSSFGIWCVSYYLFGGNTP